MRPLTELSQKKLLEGSRVAVLPVGSIEVHNEELPLGTDTFIAQAVAQLACGKSQSLLLPPVYYTYAGVTANMHGTLSVALPAMISYLTALFSAVLRSGLGPLVVISAHGGNDVACLAAMEQVFHERAAGLLYCNVLGPAYTDLITEIWGTADHVLAENLCLWAAWEMQGRPRYARPQAPAKQEGKPKRLHRIASAGHVAHSYDSPDQHIAIRDEGSVAQGHLFLDRASDRIVSVLDDLREYHREIHRD